MTVSSTSPRPEAAPVSELSARLHALRALVRRDWLVTRSYRTSLVTDLVFGFLNLLMYYFIARALHPRIGVSLDGAPSYFAFATGGIVLALVLQAGTIVLSRRVREEQLTGTLEMLVVQPIAPSELAIGLAGFPFLFAIGRAFAYLLLAGLFLGLSFAHTSWVGLIVALLSSGVAFSAIGITIASVILVFKRGDVLGPVVVTALTLLGGAVFPTQVLPGWLSALSYVVPTRYAFQALRGAQFGATSWVTPSLILIGFSVVALSLALYLFTFALRLTARRGTLNQY